MKKLSVSFLFIVILFIAMDASAAKGPRLACPDINGDVYAGYAKTFYLEVKNDGDEPLKIHEVRTSCKCTIPGLKETIVLPSKIVLLPVKYSPDKLSGSFEQPVVLFSNDPNNPQKIIFIKGNIIPSEFDSSKREIHLHAIVGSSDIPVDEVIFSSPQKMLFLGVEADPNYFESDLTQLNKNSFSVKIAAKSQPRCISVVFADMLKVHFLLDDKKEDSVEMPLVYTVSPPYTTYPSEITITNLSEDIYHRLLLKAENGYNIKIRSIKINGVEGLSTDVKKLSEQQFFVYLRGTPRKYIKSDDTGLTIELEGHVLVFVPIKRNNGYQPPL